MICFLYRLRFIQWCRSNLRNRNDKQNKAEILWNLTQHTRRENYQNVLSLSFIIASDSEIVGMFPTLSLHYWLLAISLYILICSSSAVIFKFQSLYKYYYLNQVFSLVFSFRYKTVRYLYCSRRSVLLYLTPLLAVTLNLNLKLELNHLEPWSPTSVSLH